MLTTHDGNSATVSREVRLKEVITLSQEMFESADRGEWDQFAELEKRRRSDMLACFELPVGVKEAAVVRQHIEALMQLNDRLNGLLKNAREESVRQFRALQKGRSAVQAYAGS